MARVVLVRHGESLWNAERRFQGWGGPGLTARGHGQAREVARALAGRVRQPAVLIRSDLPRVAETAAALEAAYGTTAAVDPRWREIDLGAWTGRTFAEVEREVPDDLAAWRRGEDVAAGGEERFADLRTRVRTALGDAVRVAGASGVAVVVTHGGPIRSAVALALGLATEVSLVGVPNCSVTELEVGDAGTRLVAYGAARHLSDDGGGTRTG